MKGEVNIEELKKKIKKLVSRNNEDEVKESFQDWVNIKEITKNGILLRNGHKVVILRVLPINFNLKSKLEQEAILNSYKLLLKNLNSETQIIVSSKKTDVSRHLDEVRKNTKENPQIYEMSKDYIELVNNIIEQKNTITKEFYIVLKSSNNEENDVLKITEQLGTCGNYVEECSKEQIESLLKNFLNKRLVNMMSYN